jgi:hypothetical protein
LAEIVKVSLENITPLWPQLEPLIKSVVDPLGTHDAEDVRRSLMANLSHLWVQWSDKVEACVVSEFVNYPKGLWLRLWAGAARDDTKGEWQEFRAALTHWKKINGCVGMEIIGRMGWMRVFPDARLDGVIIRTVQ